MVRESAEEVIQKVIDFRRSITGMPETVVTSGEEAPTDGGEE
jgi:hypothetical protein